MANLKMKPGDVFWEWTVIDPSRRLPGKTRSYSAALVRCSCGIEKVVHQAHLRSGNTKSCGHYRASGVWRPVKPKRLTLKAKIAVNVDPEQIEARRIIRRTWSSIKARCFNPAVPHFHRYGGRGITLWEPWRDDSEAFIDWILENLGPRPAGHSIDRIDNDGDYAPGNLRWATMSQQASNMRYRGTQSGYTGVLQTPEASTWGYRVVRDGKNYSGYGFSTPEEARDARAARVAELESAF